MITSVDEDMEELKSTYIAGGNVQWHNHSGNSLEIPEMINHGVTKWLRNLAPKYKHKRTENICQHKNWCMNIHRSIIHNS